ncbi:MAG: hypothetical protein MZW92_01455 [Comamonadaceae bacterium]|nr:hypothetical protein [Comamonadaceae bacterium]
MLERKRELLTRVVYERLGQYRELRVETRRKLAGRLSLARHRPDAHGQPDAAPGRPRASSRRWISPCCRAPASASSIPPSPPRRCRCNRSGLMWTDASFDEARQRLVELTRHRSPAWGKPKPLCGGCSLEQRKTQKRVNALKYNIIPRFRATHPLHPRRAGRGGAQHPVPDEGIAGTKRGRGRLRQRPRPAVCASPLRHSTCRDEYPGQSGDSARPGLPARFRRRAMTSGTLAANASLARDVRPIEVWAWAMYDFANSGYTTVVITAVFNAYFVGGGAQAARPGRRWRGPATLSASYGLIVVTAPVIGAIADAYACEEAPAGPHHARLRRDHRAGSGSPAGGAVRWP